MTDERFIPEALRDMGYIVPVGVCYNKVHKAAIKYIRENSSLVRAPIKKIKSSTLIICRNYSKDRDVYNSLPGSGAKKHAKAVSDLAKKLDGLIGGKSLPEKFFWGRFRGSFSSEYQDDDQYKNIDPIVLLQNLLRCIITAEHVTAEYVEGSKVGRRTKTHISNAVRDLGVLWTELTGDRVAKYIDVDPNTGAAILVNKGHLFIQQVMRVIDPKLQESEIVSALRKMSVKP